MKIAVLGTGTVGTTIASKLVSLGHEVAMGARSRNNEKAAAWARSAAGGKGAATACDFSEAAVAGEIAFNCTAGTGALEALNAAGAHNLAGKVLIDISNPLDFSRGMPPTLLFRGENSLGEQIQNAFPKTMVVKTLNTVTAPVMVEPGRVRGEHDVFMSGNDASAKTKVASILCDWFGWKNVVDLGDITTARGTESYLLLWLRLWGATNTADFNIHLVR